MNWVKIEDIKSQKKYSLVGGPFGSNLSGKHYVDEGVPVIRGTNLPFGKKFNSNGFVFVSEIKADKLKSNTAHPGDIVFTQRGTLGQVGIIPFGEFDRYIISQSQMKLSVDEEKMNTLFVYYYFRSKICLARIENLAISSGVPHINLTILRNFKIPFPSLETQTKIANILSAYDDLIENNNQRIRLLEEMAEEIYKEWFVRLRFPNYKNTPFFDKNGKQVEHGAEGALPEGWEKVKFGSLCEVARGSSPRPISDKKYFNEGTIPWIKIADATASKMYIYKTKEYVNDFGASFSRKLPKGSLIIATSGTLGFSMFLGVEGCIHDGWMYLLNYTKGFTPEFMFYVINANKAYLNNMSYGAAIQNINTQIIREIPTPKPDIKTLEKFSELINPIHSQIDLLSKKNEVLKQTRDLLLPRLISGKLSVEHLPATAEN